MAYGSGGLTGQMFNQYSPMNAEHETSLRPKQQQVLQRAQMQQQNAMDFERGREMHERGLQTQEQNRRQQEQQRSQYDSATAREIGGQKYSVLAGLVGQMGQGPSSPYGNFQVNSSSRRKTMGGHKK